MGLPILSRSHTPSMAVVVSDSRNSPLPAMFDCPISKYTSKSFSAAYNPTEMQRNKYKTKALIESFYRLIKEFSTRQRLQYLSVAIAPQRYEIPSYSDC